METTQKTANLRHCISCDFKCSKKSNYTKHLLTLKHKMLTNVDKTCSKKFHTCHCGKNYSHRQSLSIHKKKCPIIEKSDNNQENNEENIEKKDELINFLMKENQDFKNLILEIIKKDTITNNKQKYKYLL